MYGEYWEWGPGHMGGVGWVFMLLFWILVLVAIAALIRWLITPSMTSPTSVTSVPTEPTKRKALELLEERYARGEIDREEFLEKKQDLQS